MVKHVHFQHTPILKWSTLCNYYDPDNEALAYGPVIKKSVFYQGLLGSTGSILFHFYTIIVFLYYNFVSLLYYNSIRRLPSIEMDMLMAAISKVF